MPFYHRLGELPHKRHTQFRQPDGALLVLPAYELTGDDGSRWTLIAVTGDYVDFVDQPFPSPAVPSP